MRRVFATIAYDGTSFYGYQFQQGLRTVQGELETALQRIFKKAVETYVAGRTDTGVHAYGQVVTFRVAYRTMSDSDVVNALNANLPQDIYVRKVWTVPDAHNPRFLATRRVYHYYILNTREPNIFLQSRFWWFPYSLDVPSMRQAARFFEGVHDFTTFQKTSRGEEKDPVRMVYRVRVFRLQRRKILLVRVEGHSFLRRMVRNMVGALVRVGTGQWPPENIRKVILERNRAASSTCAPPQGLYLHHVDFSQVDMASAIKRSTWSENHLLEGKVWFPADILPSLLS